MGSLCSRREGEGGRRYVLYVFCGMGAAFRVGFWRGGKVEGGWGEEWGRWWRIREEGGSG